MAKKSIFGTVLAIGAVAAVAAAGAVAYLKREELKAVAEDIVSKLQPTDTEGVYTADVDGDGNVDVIMADTTGDGAVDTVLMDTDGDGSIDEAAIDMDGYGKADIVTPIECTEADFEPCCEEEECCCEKEAE